MRNPKCNRPHAKIANMDIIRSILYQFCLVCFACSMYFRVSFVLKSVVVASCSRVKSHTNGGSMNLKVHQHNESNNRELKNFWHLPLFIITAFFDNYERRRTKRF